MCPTKCHKIPLKVFKRWELYGEMGRDPNGPPCPAMYRMMDANGIGCRTCTACDKVCEGVFALAMHQKNECSVRKVQCEVCNEHMSVDELEEHKKTCYRFCKHCGPDGPRIEYKKIKERCVLHLMNALTKHSPSVGRVKVSSHLTTSMITRNALLLSSQTTKQPLLSRNKKKQIGESKNMS